MLRALIGPVGSADLALARPILAVAIVLATLAGCTSLGGGGDDDDGGDDALPLPPDPGPNPLPVERMLRCEDGKVRELRVPQFTDELSGHGAGMVIGYCPDGCRSASFLCNGDNCAGADSALCGTPPASGDPCAPGHPLCVECSCIGGGTDCAAAELAAVHARLVGKWRGMVTPPSFTTPYEVSLWIYPDGTYWAECDREICVAFYYGGDGPHPGRKITVRSAAMSGATADIGVFQGTPSGVLSALVVTDSRLAFTYNASWHNCTQPFFFDLARE